MNGMQLRTRIRRIPRTSRGAGALLVGLSFLTVFSALAVAEESGGRGGPYVMFDYVDLDPINSYLTDLGVPAFDQGPIRLYGCEGMRDREKVTFGGMYAHGTLTKQVGSQRQEFSIGFGSPIVEYRILEKKSFDLAVVGGLSITRAELTLIGPRSSRFSLTSCLFHAGLKFAYRLSERITLKAAVAYNSVPEKNWAREAGDLTPPDDFDLSSLHLRVGVRIGGRK